MLRIDPKDAVPIWRQIEQGMQRLVASGVMAPGAVVPSVRDLARELGVNPMTVSKAYQRLSDAGVLEVKRGEGTFVAAAPPTMRRAEKTRALREAAGRYVSVAVTLDVTEPQAVDEVRSSWAAIRGEKGGAR